MWPSPPNLAGRVSPGSGLPVNLGINPEYGLQALEGVADTRDGLGQVGPFAGHADRALGISSMWLIFCCIREWPEFNGPLFYFFATNSSCTLVFLELPKVRSEYYSIMVLNLLGISHFPLVFMFVVLEPLLGQAWVSPTLAGLHCKTCVCPVVDLEGVPWVPWNSSFEGLPLKILCANVWHLFQNYCNSL